MLPINKGGGPHLDLISLIVDFDPQKLCTLYKGLRSAHKGEKRAQTIVNFFSREVAHDFVLIL